MYKRQAWNWTTKPGDDARAMLDDLLANNVMFKVGKYRKQVSEMLDVVQKHAVFHGEKEVAKPDYEMAGRSKHTAQNEVNPMRKLLDNALRTVPLSDYDSLLEKLDKNKVPNSLEVALRAPGLPEVPFVERFTSPHKMGSVAVSDFTSLKDMLDSGIPMIKAKAACDESKGITLKLAHPVSGAVMGSAELCLDHEWLREKIDSLYDERFGSDQDPTCPDVKLYEDLAERCYYGKSAILDFSDVAIEDMCRVLDVTPGEAKYTLSDVYVLPAFDHSYKSIEDDMEIFTKKVNAMPDVVGLKPDAMIKANGRISKSNSVEQLSALSVKPFQGMAGAANMYAAMSSLPEQVSLYDVIDNCPQPFLGEFMSSGSLQYAEKLKRLHETQNMPVYAVMELCVKRGMTDVPTMLSNLESEPEVQLEQERNVKRG